MGVCLALLTAALSGCGGTGEWQTVSVVAEPVAGTAESVPPAKDGQDVLDEQAAPDGQAILQDPPGAQTPPTERPRVRGIYVTGPMAGTENMDQLIALVDRTELNAMVIDLKNDEGYVVCDLASPLVEEIGAVKRYVRDMPALIQKCKEKGIYLIARIVAFRDPLLTQAKPEWSLHNADGSVFLDQSGMAWVNPYEKQAWDYLAEIAQGAVELGFDEVQFDYVRFSTDPGMENVDFGAAAEGVSRTQIIEDFAADMAERVHRLGAALSADVYGMVIDSPVDQRIVGQDYAALARHLDYISPMVYPSHYGPYNYDIPVPDARPYDTVLAAMQASRKTLAGETQKRADTAGAPESVSGNASAAGEDVRSAEEIAALEPMEGVCAAVRPWLQDFTASWVAGHISYGPEQIRAQIQAVYDAGYEEWILWNASNRYTEGGLYGPDGQPTQ